MNGKHKPSILFIYSTYAVQTLKVVPSTGNPSSANVEPVESFVGASVTPKGGLSG